MSDRGHSKGKPGARMTHLSREPARHPEPVTPQSLPTDDNFRQASRMMPERITAPVNLAQIPRPNPKDRLAATLQGEYSASISDGGQTIRPEPSVVERRSHQHAVRPGVHKRSYVVPRPHAAAGDQLH